MPGPRVRCQLSIGNSRSLFARPTLFLAGHKFLMCYLGREVCKKKKATLAYTQFLMLYLMSKPLKQILQHVLGVQHYIGYKHWKNCECSPGVTFNCQVTMIVMNWDSQLSELSKCLQCLRSWKFANFACISLRCWPSSSICWNWAN